MAWRIPSLDVCIPTCVGVRSDEAPDDHAVQLGDRIRWTTGGVSHYLVDAGSQQKR
jgi:hypothetical protein